MKRSMKRIELLLLENVENLGIVGDVVKVKPGYARNYLLPHLLATTPSEEKIAAIQERRAQVEKELAEKRSIQEALLEKVAGYELTLERACNEQGILYGGVSQHDIAVGLQEAGFAAITDSNIRIGEQIKRLDSFTIPVQLANDLKTEIKLWVVSDKPLDLDEEVEAAEQSSEAVEEEKDPYRGSAVDALGDF